MKDPGGVLNGLEQAEENWFSNDGDNKFNNASDDASIQASPFFIFKKHHAHRRQTTK